MAKEFYTNGIGSAQTLNPSDESKIKIYDSKVDADLDLANIEENEIIATKAGESEGVVEVVDTVEEDNPNAVSSGAVYDFALGLRKLDWANAAGLSANYINTGFNSPSDGLLIITAIYGATSGTSASVTVEGVVVAQGYYSGSDYRPGACTIPVNKGDFIQGSNIQRSNAFLVPYTVR